MAEMDQDPLRGAIDTVVHRLREELEVRLGELSQQHLRELDAARRTAEASAEERWTARLAAEREQAASREAGLAEQLQTARAEPEALTLRLEMAEPARRSGVTDGRARNGAAADPAVEERQVRLAMVERLLGAMRSMDMARSLSEVLSALLGSVADETARAAVFVLDGDELRHWKSAGFRDAALDAVAGARSALLNEVRHRGEPVATASDAGPAPGFVDLPPDSAALALPLHVGGKPVAVLYADNASDAPREAPASWPEAVQILARHASTTLAHLTAARAVEALQLSAASAGSARTSAGSPVIADDTLAARRYARLLVSEIALHNEEAVRMGRQAGDLMERLKPQIDSARKLYDQRVTPSADADGAVFREELLHALAGADPALPGGHA
jgi:hypothetical protein